MTFHEYFQTSFGRRDRIPYAYQIRLGTRETLLRAADGRASANQP